MREVEKYPSIVGFEPGTLALIANVLTNFAERTDVSERDLCGVLVYQLLQCIYVLVITAKRVSLPALYARGLEFKSLC